MCDLEEQHFPLDNSDEQKACDLACLMESEMFYLINAIIFLNATWTMSYVAVCRVQNKLLK